MVSKENTCFFRTIEFKVMEMSRGMSKLTEMYRQLTEEADELSEGDGFPMPFNRGIN